MVRGARASGAASSTPERYWLDSSMPMPTLPPSSPHVFRTKGGNPGFPSNVKDTPSVSSAAVSSPIGRSCIRGAPWTRKRPIPAASTAVSNRQVVPDSCTSQDSGSTEPPCGCPPTPEIAYSPSPVRTMPAPAPLRIAIVRSKSLLSSTRLTTESP